MDALFILNAFYFILLSISSKYCFLHSPPPYPVSCPSEPMTLWHGMRIEILFIPLALATALTASGFHIHTACSLYDFVIPIGISCKAFQTRFWNTEPGVNNGTLKVFLFHSKYSLSCRSNTRKCSLLPCNIIAFNNFANLLNSVSSIFRSVNSKRQIPSFVAQAYIVPRGVSIRLRSMIFWDLLWFGETQKILLNESPKPLNDSKPVSKAVPITLSPLCIFLKAEFILEILWYAWKVIPWFFKNQRLIWLGSKPLFTKS